ncbi:MAG: hypothetical protein ACTHN0_19030 [Aquihabitans sp.]
MRRHPIIALLVLIPVLSLLAGCGTSGGKEAVDTDAKTTTTAASDDEGTDEPVDDETTTTAEGDDEGDSDRPSTEALVDILPTAEDIGNGYEMSDEDLGEEAGEDDSDDQGTGSEDDPDPTEQAMIEQCPGAKFLEELDDSGESTTEISREFENAAEATIEVALDPEPPKFTEDTVDKLVEALSDCGTIEADDGEGGTIKMTMKAEDYDDNGDFGVAVEMDAEYTMMGSTIPIAFRGVIFSVDGTAVSVVATSGLDEDTYEQVDGDYDLLPDLADLMAERVGSL